MLLSENCYKGEGAWPEEAIHVKILRWSGGAREHYASEISDRKKVHIEVLIKKKPINPNLTCGHAPCAVHVCIN